MPEVYVVLAGFTEKCCGMRYMDTTLVTAYGDVAYREFESQKKYCAEVDVEVWRGGEMERAVWWEEEDGEEKTVWG